MDKTLPVWDLTEFYRGFDDPALAADMTKLSGMVDEFSRRYKGQVGQIDSDTLADALHELETIQNLRIRIGDFASLSRAISLDDESALNGAQDVDEQLADIDSALLFFELEINRIDDRTMDALLGRSKTLGYFAPWLRDVRAMRPYRLADDVEEMLARKEPVGAGALVRLYDETASCLRYSYRGESLTENEIDEKLVSSSSDVRRAAAAAIDEVLLSQRRQSTFIYNTLLKDKAIEDKARNFPTAMSAQHLANGVSDDVVTALAASTFEAMPRISHRYYALKARWSGVRTIPHYDRRAPLERVPDRYIPWDEARNIVIDAYRGFSAEAGICAERFFTEPWIDALPRPGKEAGGFAMEGPTDGHPHVLVNYRGLPEDVLVLAHEIGHGIHGMLAARNGPLMADMPVTIAETASVFGEMLTFQSLLSAESDPRLRKALIAQKVEAMLDTTMRQIAIFEFEARAHTSRREGEISAAQLEDAWLDVMGKVLGPAVTLEGEYGLWWSRIPHIFHAPFYVYAYAFGDCLVNSLYRRYLEDTDGFPERYLELLRAGGTKQHRELLAPFGLDARDPEFWSNGLSVIEGLVDILEGIDDEPLPNRSAGA